MNDAAPLPLLHLDEHLLVVDKPAGLLAHASKMAADVDVDLLDRLRQQVQGAVFLVHRLDRATSGLVLAARTREAAGELGKQFMARSIEKSYLAVCRGWPEETGEIDCPLGDVRPNSAKKPALTRYRRLATVEVPIALGKYRQQRYALMAVDPETGRYRQIRKHFHHISHHLIGDTSHGRTEHNRLFQSEWQVGRLLLHAHQLAFTHPATGDRLAFVAPLDQEFQRVIEVFGWTSAAFPAGFPVIPWPQQANASLDRRHHGVST
jgi:tRNA pseudouridine65 synthase